MELSCVELSWIESKLNSNYSSLNWGERRKKPEISGALWPNRTTHFRLESNGKKKKKSMMMEMLPPPTNQDKTNLNLRIVFMHVLSHGFQKTMKTTICPFCTHKSNNVASSKISCLSRRCNVWKKKLLSFERCGEAFDFDSIKAYIWLEDPF